MEDQVVTSSPDGAGPPPESSDGPSVREALDGAFADSNVGGKVSGDAPPRGAEQTRSSPGESDSSTARDTASPTVRSDIQQAAKTIGHQNDAKAAGFETPLHHLSAAALPYCQQHNIGGVEELVGTALYAEYTLRTGTPQEKAEVVQWICQQYGVPVPQGAGAPRASSTKPKGRGRPETVRDTLHAAHAQRKH